ncbi:MAG TPA: alanine--glyoxylate aminotransferase family protein [Trueperaceae bacterium]|nr:alanine--glyoxylate aminotransferase family protein [Trueperaceae bacterium]
MEGPRLFAPGPVPVPPQVLAALARPVLHHRGPEFRELFARVRASLAQVFAVPGDDVVVVTGSGSAAFEAALLACVPAGAEVLCLRSGRFGEKWVGLCRRFGFAVSELAAAYGEEYDLGRLADELRARPGVAAVVVVHSETSTGTLHDVAAVARTVREAAPDALVVVDAVSSLAAAELRPREWGLDAVVSGSQKGVMTPPGLGFAWLSERAWARSEGLLPTGYLDLRRERARQAEGGAGSTPATSLVAGLDVALGLILEQGLEARWREKERLNRALLAAGEACGLRPFARRPSPAVAALEVPEGVGAKRLTNALRERGLHVGGGQGDLAERIVRPSLLGWADRHDLTLLAGALEEASRAVGLDVPHGAATGAAARAWETAA